MFGDTQEPARQQQSHHAAGDSVRGSLEPALMKFEDKSYSLEPDMINGWRPHRRLYKQLPLRTTQSLVDSLVREYTRLGATTEYRVMYLGARPSSNLQLMRAYCWRDYDHNCKEAGLYGLQRLRRYQFLYNRERSRQLGQPAETRLFVGMNPTIDNDQLLFDAEFECGNLDLAMKVAPEEYDLFMRVDTNTRGHNSWFMWRCRNTRAAQTVRFNICNFRRPCSLFTQGMRPSVFSRLGAHEWQHAGINVTYTRSQLRYPICEQETAEQWCLSFEYTFEKDFDEVYFAYSVPYSYSYLLHFLEELERLPDAKRFLKVSYQLESPGGLSIPVVTVSNPSQQREKKKVVLVTGRMHPGEPQGSWTLHGFMKHLCSEEGKELRDRATFKIVPMVNVDGVVAGNFRTGLLGLDLNRLFKHSSEDYYEVEYIKEIARACGSQILLYLDFHGHSTRKNVFIYGPDYKLSESQFMVSRILPKVISKLTDTFRYFSCIFRISKQKETTGRAIMFREFGVPYCYTVESSAYSYFSSRGEVPFSAELYQRSGSCIAEGTDRFLQLLKKIEVRRQEIKREKKRTKELKIQVYREVQVIKIQRQEQRSKRKAADKAKKKKGDSSLALPEGLGDLEELLNDIRQDEKNMDAQSKDMEESDCQKDDDDYGPLELSEIMNKSIATVKQKDPISNGSTLKRSNIYRSLQRVKDGSSGIIQPPKHKVIIRDFVEEFKHKNRRLVSGRSIHYERSADELPEIKSSRLPPKKRVESMGNRHEQRIVRSSRWASNYNCHELPPTHLARLKMATLDQRPQGSIEEFENKLVVRQGCVVNLRIDSESEHSSEGQKATNMGRFPEALFRKQVTRKKRRLQITEAHPQVPEVVSDVLRRHLPIDRSKLTERSVQILRL